MRLGLFSSSRVAKLTYLFAMFANLGYAGLK